MSIRKFVAIVLVYVSFGSCKPGNVRTELAGYTIQFPITMADLRKNHPNGYTSGSNKFIDSSQSARAEWWFNNWGSIGNRDPRNQPYGVVIFLKNKSNQVDSVKTALEEKYTQSIKPLLIEHLKGDFTKINPPIYIYHIDTETILVLTKAVSYRGDPWSEYNSLRISIGYNLSQKEEEIFALLDGSIHEYPH